VTPSGGEAKYLSDCPRSLIGRSLKQPEVAQNINRPHDVVNLFVDSQAAIRSMQSSTVSSKNVMASRDAPDSLSTTKSVRIYWVPSHQGIAGNETADVFAKKGVEVTNGRTESVPISLQSALVLKYSSCEQDRHMSALIRNY